MAYKAPDLINPKSDREDAIPDPNQNRGKEPGPEISEIPSNVHQINKHITQEANGKTWEHTLSETRSVETNGIYCDTNITTTFLDAYGNPYDPKNNDGTSYSGLSIPKGHRVFCEKCKRKKKIVPTYAGVDSKQSPYMGEWLCMDCFNYNESLITIDEIFYPVVHWYLKNKLW